MKIVAVGDNCVDIYANLGKTFPGGGPVNFAVQACRAGVDAAYVGLIGDDTHGDWIADALVEEGVDITHLIRQHGPTARAWVELVNRDRTFIRSDRGVREQLVITPDMHAFIAGADLVHTTLDGRVDAYIAEWYAAGCRVSYDFSYRATPAQIELLPYVAVAFFSGQAFNLEEAREQAITLQRHAAGIVVITLGARGSLAYDGVDDVFQPAVYAEVVDTLGAGDAFQAAFMLAYLRGDGLGDALHAGAVCAAQACTSLGGFGHGHESLD